MPDSFPFSDDCFIGQAPSPSGPLVPSPVLQGPPLTRLPTPATLKGQYVRLSKEQLDPAFFDRMIQWLPKCSPNGPFLLGGALRRYWTTGESPTDLHTFGGDFDYFTTGAPEQRRLLESWCECHEGVLVRDTEHHTTYTVILDNHQAATIQLIKTRYLPTMQEHLDRFDLTICQLGWDGESLMISHPGLHDLARKELHLVGGPLESPWGTWSRVAKYAAQGYTPGASVIQDLLTQIGTTPKPTGRGTY